MRDDAIVISCPTCAAKNRIPRDRLDERPICGRCKTPLSVREPARDHPLDVTDRSFEREVLSSSLPVLLDCRAAWCGPCRMVSPILEELARAWIGQIRVAKLNVDENQLTASKYRIQSIPTLILFRGGQEVDRMVGAVPREHIEQWLQSRL